MDASSYMRTIAWVVGTPSPKNICAGYSLTASNIDPGSQKCQFHATINTTRHRAGKPEPTVYNLQEIRPAKSLIDGRITISVMKGTW